MADKKVAVVTGGAGGIGQAIAARFIGEGVRVMVADIDGDKARRVAKELSRDGSMARAVEVDVTRLDSIQNMVNETLRFMGKIDILVTSHGVNRRKPLEEVTEEDWDVVIDVNLKGTYFCGQLVGKVMKTRGRGSIVNIASIMSVSSLPHLSVYCASKGGVAQITRAFAVEWAQDGINVNAVAPGYIKTELTAQWLDDPERYRDIISKAAMGKLATVEDVAAAVSFLASDAARNITGQILFVDAGWTVW